MADYRLQIVTQQRTVFDDKVTSLVLPGEDGYLGIRANHAPIISVLKAGDVTMRRGGKEQRFHIGGGFIEMSDNKATLLADTLSGLDDAAAH